jgi:hypothetical protein
MTEYFTRDGHLSHLVLERFHSGELNDSLIQQHLVSCVECKHALASLKAHEVAFSLSPPATTKKSRPMMVYGSMLAAAAATLVFVLAKPSQDPGQSTPGAQPGWVEPADVYRTKGGLSVEFFLERNDVVTRALNGTSAHPGDRLGFRVSTNSVGHLMIAAIDGTHTPFLYYPQDTNGRSQQFGPSQEMVTLDQAIVLDDALGEEQLVVLFCEKPFGFNELAENLKSARRGEAKSGFPYPANCRERTITMTKKKLGPQ